MRDLQSYIDEEFRKFPEEAMRLYGGKAMEEALQWPDGFLIFDVPRRDEGQVER